MFGERLKALRAEAGLSQKALASKLFISQQAVAGWELEKGSPNPETLAKIADILNVSTDYLIGRTNQRDEKQPIPVPGDGLDKKQRMVYERLSRLSPENLEIAIGQLDVLLKLQEKRDKS